MTQSWASLHLLRRPIKTVTCAQLPLEAAIRLPGSRSAAGTILLSRYRAAKKTRLSIHTSWDGTRARSSSNGHGGSSSVEIRGLIPPDAFRVGRVRRRTPLFGAGKNHVFLKQRIHDSPRSPSASCRCHGDSRDALDSINTLSS